MLIKFVKMVYQEANIEWVANRIQSLCRSFRKDLQKVEDSKKSVSSADSLHVPSLWYYDLLLLTRDQEELEEIQKNVKNEKAIVLQKWEMNPNPAHLQKKKSKLR
jgi:hypothetical protein